MTKMHTFLVLPMLILASCSHFQRSSRSGYGSGYGNESSGGNYSNMSDSETRRTAYELGKDPNSLSSRDLNEIQARQRVREMEKSLRSNKEREQYSKILPWLAGDKEKIEFLSIPSIEGRQRWINSKDIWSRSQAPRAEMKDLMETQDIAVGMPQDYVRRSWGEPLSVEVSGNPIYKNERWRYQRFVSGSEGYRQETRFVYFEGGRVVGWETQ